MYYDEKSEIFRWDNDLPVKNTEGSCLPGRCKACNANWTVELTVGVVVRCDGPCKHFFGVLDDPIKHRNDILYGVYLREE